MSLQDQARARVQLAEALGVRFAGELDAVLRALERRLLPWVRSIERPADVLGRMHQATAARRTLDELFQLSGFPGLMGDVYGERLDPWLATILGDEAPDVWWEATIDLRHLHASDLLRQEATLRQTLWQVLARGLFSARSTLLIAEDLTDALDAAEPILRTQYDTTVSILGRQVEAIKADPEPDTRFLYAGPDDQKTRSFCEERVNQVYTRAEIEQMDNGQIPNVFLTGGGYNCRHVWMEVVDAS